MAALHDAALDATTAIVDGIPVGKWDEPTPCAAWSVREVVGHLAWGNAVFATLLHGAPFREPPGRTVALSDPPAAAYRATVDQVRQALRDAGAPDTVQFPIGPVPLAAALQTRVQDLVVHGWDLCVATGTTLRIDDALIAAAERTATERLAAGTLTRSQFAPPGDLTGATSALDRLLLTLGRDPHPTSRNPG